MEKVIMLPDNHIPMRSRTAGAVFMAVLFLSSLAFADINPVERQAIPFANTYEPHIVSFPAMSCREYNAYDNGPLTQDLMITGIPSGAVLLMNSYGEVKKDGITIASSYGSQLAHSSYSTDTMSFDLPRSLNDSDTCTGTFYIVFAGAPAVVTEDNTTATTTTTAIAPATSTTLAAIPPQEKSLWQQLQDIVNSIIRAVFGG